MIRQNPKWTKETADLPCWLSGGLYRFYCHWQRINNIIIFIIGIINKLIFFLKKLRQCPPQILDRT